MDKNFELLQAGTVGLKLLVELENNSWVPELQASRDTILKRLELGHIMLCVPDSERRKIIGKICFLYNNFDPEKSYKFPKKFSEFSSMPKLNFFNAAFVYDLDIEHNYRDGGKLARFLVHEAIKRAKKDGCKYIVGDGRCPSYNGSKIEGLKQNICFKRAIDEYIEKEIFPQQKDFLLDPTLAFYHRVTGCKFLWIIPDFIPEDKASGGIRVILYKEI